MALASGDGVSPVQGRVGRGSAGRGAASKGAARQGQAARCQARFGTARRGGARQGLTISARRAQALPTGFTQHTQRYDQQEST